MNNRNPNLNRVIGAQGTARRSIVNYPFPPSPRRGGILSTIPPPLPAAYSLTTL
jgi:hypothetical protein